MYGFKYKNMNGTFYLGIFAVTQLVSVFCNDCKDWIENNHINASYENKPHRLFLVSTTTNYDEFEEECRQFTLLATKLGFHVVKFRTDNCTDGLEATKIIAEKLYNVVNLHVEVDSGNLDINTTELITVGYSSYKEIYDNTTTVCKTKPGKYKLENNREHETCEESPTVKHKYIFKLISKSIKQYEKLFYILEYIDFSRTVWKEFINKLSVIMVCVDEDTHALQIKEPWIRFVKNCKKIEPNNDLLLTVLAPRPLELDMNTNVTVLFYDIPFILPEHKIIYKNSLVLYDKYYDILIKALLVFMKKNQWNRLAVVSDDSPYSDVFEAKLIKVFKRKQTVYAVRSCLEKVCDFEKALKSLEDIKARIIVVNVDKRYAPKLVEAANKLHLISREGFMWIWKDWPFSDDFATRVLGQAFSLYIAPNITNTTISGINVAKINCITSRLQYHKGDIIKGIKSYEMHRLLDEAKRDCTMTVYIRRIKTNNADIVFSYNVHERRSGIFKKLRYSDVSTYCNFPSTSFSFECDDIYLLLMTLVISMLVLAVISIMCFFDHIGKRTLSGPRRHNYNTL